MAIDTNDVRKGTKLSFDGDVWDVVDFQHARTAQRRANVWVKIRNLRTGAMNEKTFRAGDSLETPDFEAREMRFIFAEVDYMTFMDQQNYDQIAFPRAQIEQFMGYIKEGVDYRVLIHDGIPIALEMPAMIVLLITDCEPAVKGDSVNNLTKLATTETGLIVKVPLFVDTGDSIKIDTRTGEYLGRSN